MVVSASISFLLNMLTFEVVQQNNTYFFVRFNSFLSLKRIPWSDNNLDNGVEGSDPGYCLEEYTVNTSETTALIYKTHVPL